MVRSNYWGRRQPIPVSSFSRSSVAYLNGVQYAANTRRTKTLALVSTSDGAIPSAAGEGGEHIKVQCIANGYIFGIGVTSLRVYKSSDGVTWARTSATQIVSASLNAVSGGRLIGFASSSTADPTYYTQAWYSDDNWDTVVAVTYDTTRTPASVVLSRNCRCHGNIVIINEYGPSSALGGRYMYRSADNGATFTKVADLADQTPDPYHWHTVGYHSATGRWLAFFGDNIDKRGVMYSDDDGVTWANLHTVGSYPDQPLVCYDFGNPTDLLVGCDGPTTVGRLNVATGEIVSYGIQGDQRPTRHYVFSLGKYGSVYYAGGFDNSGSSPAPVIMISDDLNNWSVYHKFLVADGVSGINKYVGYFNGKIFLDVDLTSGVSRTFAISPAKIRNVGGVLIEPAVTNLASSVDASCFDGSVGWTAATTGWTVSRVTSEDYVKSATAACMRGVGTDGDPAAQKNSASPNILLGAVGEKKYIIQAYVKATRPIPVSWKLYKNFSPTGYVDTANDTIFMADRNWKLYRSRPYTVAAGEIGNYKVYLGAVQGTLATEIFVDGFQVIEVPVSEWQIGGSAKSADILSETVSAPYEWTDIFAVQTLGQLVHYGAAANLYIKSWKVGSDEIQLYYNVSDGKFYLQRNAETAVGSAAQEWHPNQVIKFSLRADASGLTLDIQNGRAKEQITDSALAAVLNAELTMIYGDISSANQFPGVYFDGSMDADNAEGIGFIPFKLTDAEVAAAFNLAPTAGIVRPVHD